MAAVLFVVANTAALTSGETTIQTRLASTLGHTVTLADASAADTAASGKALVVVSAAVTGTTLAAKYKTVTVPVLSHHHTHWQNLGMCSGSTITTQKWFAMNPTYAGHPLAAGLTGDQTGYNPAVGMYRATTAQMGSGAPLTIASAFSAGTDQWNYFAYPTGATMQNGSAPARRIAFTMEDGALPSIQTAGWALWDAAISWALSSNVPPTANAGPDQQVFTGTQVTLNGTGSTDSDGTITARSWRQISGPSVTLSSTTVASPTFTPTVVGSYVFGLTVTDNSGDTSIEDTVTITVALVGGKFFALSGAWTYKPVSAALSGGWH